MKNPLVTNLTLLLIAIVWGFGFVPQREGMNYVDPMAFNALRFTLGAISLLPLLMLVSSVTMARFVNPSTILLGFMLGVLLFAGATFQQISIQFTTLGNVAFITGLYVIIVPMIGVFIGYKYTSVVWLGGIIAMAGLYLMTGTSIDVKLKGDLLVLVSALFWAIHLLVLARKTGRVNQLVLAFYQFVFCALLSLPAPINAIAPIVS